MIEQPTRVSWYRDSRTVILMEFPARYTWDDFWAAKAEADALMDTVDHDCALIIHGPADTRLPDNALSQSRSLLNRRHPRSALFLILMPNAMIRAVTKLLGQLYMPKRGLIQGITSLEEADRILRAQGYLPRDAAETAS